MTAPRPPHDVLTRALRVAPERTGATLAELHRPVRDPDDLADLLERVATAATTWLPAADCAGVMVDFDDDVFTAASTDPAVVALNRVQQEEDDGPCRQAMRTGATVSAGPAEAARRWPRFADRGAQDGLVSFLSVPLVDGAGTHGSVSLHSRRAADFTADERDYAAVLAHELCRGLGDYRAITAAREQAEHLRTALASRPVIDQAKGILMAVHRVDADGAFALLRERSRTSGAKLRDVAAQFVAEHTGA